MPLLGQAMKMNGIRMTHRGRNRMGFTIIELLVVIAVIGMLAAFIVPAVQAIRASARRMQCSQNLKQIGIAIHSYLSTSQMFPGGEAPMLAILDHLEQHQLAIALRNDFFSILTVFDKGAVIPHYICPDDAIAASFRGRCPSYLLNGGSGVQRYGWNGFWASEITMPPIFIAPAAITDGLSNTAAMSEMTVAGDSGESATFRKRFSAMTAVAKWSATELNSFADDCQTSPIWPSNYFQPNAGLLLGWSLPLGYNHIMTPNLPSCSNGSPVLFQGRKYHAKTANSLHAQGVNVLMCDGSVRFVNDGMDRLAWRAIGSRNGAD